MALEAVLRLFLEEFFALLDLDKSFGAFFTDSRSVAFEADFEPLELWSFATLAFKLDLAIDLDPSSRLEPFFDEVSLLDAPRCLLMAVLDDFRAPLLESFGFFFDFEP